MAAVGKVSAGPAARPPANPAASPADTARVGHQEHHDLREVLAALRAEGSDGTKLADALDPILHETGPGRLLLGHPDEQGWDFESDRLLVISTAGLTLPRHGVDEADWDLSEQLAIPLMSLGGWLAHRRVRNLPKGEPKLVGLDELHWLARIGSGRALVHQFARDNRKFRARVFVAGQLASDVLHLDGAGSDEHSELAGLVHDVFVGRTVDHAAQADALRLLRVPTGIGYEQHLGQLSGQRRTPGPLADQPREFIWRSGEHCETVCLDISGAHLGGLRAALETNAARRADAR
jgi:hypothetical protein